MGTECVVNTKQVFLLTQSYWWSLMALWYSTQGKQESESQTWKVFKMKPTNWSDIFLMTSLTQNSGNHRKPVPLCGDAASFCSVAHFLTCLHCTSLQNPKPALIKSCSIPQFNFYGVKFAQISSWTAQGASVKPKASRFLERFTARGVSRPPWLSSTTEQPGSL